MNVFCEWCGHEVNRSPSAIRRVSHVFCSKICKNRFEQMKRDLIKEAEWKDLISRKLNYETNLLKKRYGGSG